MTDDLIEAQLAAAKDARIRDGNIQSFMGFKYIKAPRRPWLSYEVSFTPRHWEFGFGFFVGNEYTDRITGFPAYSPPLLTLMLGPLTLQIQFGREIDYCD